MAAMPWLRQSMPTHCGGSNQSQASLNGICGEQSGTGTQCSKVPKFSHQNYPTNAPD